MDYFTKLWVTGKEALLPGNRRFWYQNDGEMRSADAGGPSPGATAAAWGSLAAMSAFAAELPVRPAAAISSCNLLEFTLLRAITFSTLCAVLVFILKTKSHERAYPIIM